MSIFRQLIFVSILSCLALPSLGDDLEEIRRLRDTTINLVNALVDQGILTRDKADALIAQAQAAAAKSANAPSSPAAATAPAGAAAAPSSAAPAGAAGETGTVRVPYIPDTVKQEIGAEVKRDVLAQAKTERWGSPDAYPDWLHRFTWYGDIRLRYEADLFPTDNKPNATVQTLQFYGVNIANSTEEDNRLRIRARFGFDAVVADTVSAGIRLVTGGVGTGSNPGSDNQTLGNYETRSTVGLDRAFLDYHPLPDLHFLGGRVGNPYYRPTTLVWADDVSLEGVVMAYSPQVTQSLRWTTTAGALPILQIDPNPLNSASSKWLYAYQTGIALKFDEIAEWRLAAALYDYRHIEGIPNPNIYSTQYSSSAAPYRQTGNTVFDINGLLNTQNGTQNYLWGLASKFHVLNVSTYFDVGFVGPTHAMLSGDYVYNLGFDANEIFQRTGFTVAKQVRGWDGRIAVGFPVLQARNSWQAYIGYRYVQRDATLDAFTDQDFHLGGTDAQGYYLGASYAFAKNSVVRLRWFSAKQIDGVERAGEDGAYGLPLAIDVVQLDFVAGF